MTKPFVRKKPHRTYPAPDTLSPTTTELSKIGRYIREKIGPGRDYLLIIDRGSKSHTITTLPQSSILDYLRDHIASYNPLTKEQRKVRPDA